MARSAPRARSTSRRFGDFELDVAAGVLRCRGRRVPVEPKAFDVLVYLVEHRERVVSVDELLARVWRGVAVERGSVHRAVRLLRRALEAEGGPPAIETVARRGYRFALAPHGAARAAGGARYVGRGAVLGELERRIEGARAGRPELVLLHGPAGIGKTTTLEWVARRAAAGGACVLEGRCLEAPGAAPYRPWSRVLRAAIRADGPDAIARELGPGVADVVRAMPELGAALDPGAARAPRDRGSREGIHDALSEWIRLRCERAPLLLAFDDLHRADLDSIEVLASVVRETGAGRLLVVATYRDAPGSSATHRSIAALAALRPGAALRLGELSRAEVREFAALRSGEAPAESAIERLAAASGGNPLFLEHLLRTDAESGGAAHGPGLRGALLRLLEDASPSCVDVLAQACVCGRELDVATIAASLGRPPASVQADVVEAFALHLLEPDAEGDARFVHGLIPDLLYAGLPELERVERHRRTLDGILATPHDARDRSAEIAHHASEAASVIGAARAFEHLVAAAREARDRFAYGEAVAWFERALALRGGAADREAARAACLVELATLLVLLGDAEAARPRFARACELARELDDPQLFARAALGPSQVEEYQELDRAQVAALREAIERLGDRDPGLRVELLIAFARTGYYGDPDLMLGATEEALVLARGIGAPELVCRAALARSVALGWTQQHAERRDLVEEANQIARRTAPAPLVTGAALLHAARECLAEGDRVGFEREVRRLETLADAQRLAFFDWSLAAIRGTRALFEGRFADASTGVERLLERGRRANPVLAFQIAAVHRTMVALAIEAPAPVVALLRPLAERFPEVTPWSASLAATLAASGRDAEAAVEVERLLRADLRPRHRDFLPVVLAMLAQTAQRLGDARLAAVVAGELARIGDRCIVLAECLAFQGAVDRYRGLCAEAAGDATSAVDLYERGLHADEAMGALPCVARGRFDLGRALRLRGAAGDAAAAERSFAAASDLAARLGMRPLLEEIHAASGGS